MILSFSQKWPASMGEWAGQPTMFTNKIMKTIWKHYGKQATEFIHGRSIGDNEKFDRLNVFEPMTVMETQKLTPKLHTLREDPNNRWHVGSDIQFAINPRSKNYFQFAPTIPCVSTQTIQIIDSAYTRDNSGITIEYSHRHKGGVEEYVKHWEVIVDGIALKGPQIEELAINDGFDSVDQFFAWFNKDWKGKIIHWTPLKY